LMNYLKDLRLKLRIV